MVSYFNETWVKNDVISSQELGTIGLSRSWCNLMEEVGFETFVLVWRALEDPRETKKLDKRIVVPKFSQYRDTLLARFIDFLKCGGLTKKEMMNKILFVFGEKVDLEEKPLHQV